MVWQCHYCRVPLSAEVMKKNRLCPNCNSELHACKNCVHYDENLSSKCNEPNSPWVADRGGLNDCEWFEFKKVRNPATAPHQDDVLSEAERAKEAFRALFRNP